MEETMPSPQPAKRKKLYIIAALALIILVAILSVIFLLQKNKNQNQAKIQPIPSPTIIPTSKETLDLLKLVPIKKDGQYTFEYLSNAQTFYLRIENKNRNLEIRQEIANLIKKTTEEGNYCKFHVLVWSYGSKDTVLPGC